MLLLEELRTLDETGRWNPTFQMINLETRKQQGMLEMKEARMPQNRSRNRYRDVLPYDSSRIILQSSEGGDYINANLVEVPVVSRKYILTQGPLPHTCADFWRMIWEQQSNAVVMLNKVIEKNMVKCHPYWPMGENEIIEFEEFKLTNLAERMAASYITREFLLEDTNSGDSRLVKHFHYVLWPDFGVPRDPKSFLDFLEDIRSSGALSENAGPPVIHCSAGIGRSGTFCLVDSALALAEKQNTADGLNLKNMLLELRKYRLGLIQTAEQLRYAYLAVIEGLSKLFPEGSDCEEDPETTSRHSKLEIEEPERKDSPHQRNAPAKPPRIVQDTINKQLKEEQEHQKRLFEKLIALESSEDSEEEEETIDLSDLSDEDNIADAPILKVQSEHKEDKNYATKPLPPLPSKLENDIHSLDTDLEPSLPKKMKLEGARTIEGQDENVNIASHSRHASESHTISNEVPVDDSQNVERSSLESRRASRHDINPSMGSKASESSDQLRHRRAERASKTKELVDEIKKQLIESEMNKANQNMWLRSGIALGICAGLFIMYKVIF